MAVAEFVGAKPLVFFDPLRFGSIHPAACFLLNEPRGEIGAMPVRGMYGTKHDHTTKDHTNQEASVAGPRRLQHRGSSAVYRSGRDSRQPGGRSARRYFLERGCGQAAPAHGRVWSRLHSAKMETLGTQLIGDHHYVDEDRSRCGDSRDGRESYAAHGHAVVTISENQRRFRLSIESPPSGPSSSSVDPAGDRLAGFSPMEATRLQKMRGPLHVGVTFDGEGTPTQVAMVVARSFDRPPRAVLASLAGRRADNDSGSAIWARTGFLPRSTMPEHSLFSFDGVLSDSGAVEYGIWRVAPRDDPYVQAIHSVASGGAVGSRFFSLLDVFGATRRLEATARSSRPGIGHYVPELSPSSSRLSLSTFMARDWVSCGERTGSLDADSVARWSERELFGEEPN